MSRAKESKADTVKPRSLWTEGPLGSRLNAMPDETFPNDEEEEDQ